MSFEQFLIAGVEICIHRFGQSNVCAVIRREVMSQFPNTLDQRRVRITLRWQRRKSGVKSIPLVARESVAGRQPPNRPHHFDIDQ